MLNLVIGVDAIMSAIMRGTFVRAACNANVRLACQTTGHVTSVPQNPRGLYYNEQRLFSRDIMKRCEPVYDSTRIE